MVMIPTPTVQLPLVGTILHFLGAEIHHSDGHFDVDAREVDVKDAEELARVL